MHKVQVHALQEQAILPALQCEAGQDHPQGRFASHMMASGTLAADLARLGLAPIGKTAQTEGWPLKYSRRCSDFPRPYQPGGSGIIVNWTRQIAPR
jgi:hypothetical protein